MADIIPVEPFSVTTSTCSASACTISTPSFVFTLTPKPRLLRFDEAKEALISVDITTRMKSG